MKKYQLLVLLLSFVMVTGLTAQKFGVRAGVNYNTIAGPLESSAEELTFTNGFHFGINYSYLVNDVFSVRGEIGYVQNGYRQKYNGDGFYIIRSAAGTTYEKGKLNIDLKNSSGYISIPVVANIRLHRKLEVNAGLYANVLVSPTGQGTLRFESHDNPEGITFRQSLVYSYNTDSIGYQKGGLRGEGIGIYVDNKVVTLSQTAGAYYQYGEDLGNFINRVDFGVTGGIDYFINRGFYVGLGVEYGFSDITNDKADFRRGNLSDNNEFVLDKHHDPNFGIRASIGFRF